MHNAKFNLVGVLLFTRFQHSCQSDCRIVIDYGFLAEKYKELYEPEEVKREGDKLQRHVTELGNTIQRIQAPNMRVSLLSIILLGLLPHRSLL